MKRISIERNILEKNNESADFLRELLKKHNCFSINLMSSPGAGKTTLAERMIESLKSKYSIAVIDGDLDTTRDADRLASHGVNVIQINTNGACHLDADMVKKAIPDIGLDNLDLLIIENVGNLVCPASFDVGTNKNVVLLSTPEGDDKVKKYPTMFNVADVVLINKMDLAKFVEFDVSKVEREIKDVNSKAEIIQISAKNGEGIDKFIAVIERFIKKETQ